MGKILAAYGGGFKPPTAGHFEIVEKSLQEFPEIDEFVIFVGGKVRDGIEQEESILVWDIYKKYLANKVRIEPVKSPIGEILRLAKNNPQDLIYFVIGYRDGRQDDLDDVAARTGNLKEKYPNIVVKVIPTYNPNMSGTNARKALNQSEEEFFNFLPSKVKEKSEIFQILRPPINEKKDPKKGTGKKPEGSKRRLYTDEDPKDTVGIKFSTRQDIVDTLNKVSFKSKSHARQSQIINLIHQRVRAAYGRAKDPAVKKRLKTALDYAKQRKEASKSKTQRLKNKKNENVAPNHNGKAAPFGSGYNKVKENINEEITKSQLDAIEVYADKLFAKLGIDIEFTKHFLDRVNDKRNIKPISVPELVGMFKRLHKKHGKPLSKVDDDFDAVVKDFNNNINIPFAINVTPNDIDLVAKTVMRKKDFKTSTPVIALNENATYSKNINVQDKIDQLTQYMIDKGLNIEPLPSVELVDGDSENASDFFGKTAYYDPEKNHIVLYTEGRHPKDIVRSYAHEMIHHIQNLEDRLENINTTNTTEDDNLEKIEKEAYTNGNITFRNWTDTLNESVVGDKIKCDECGWSWNIVDGGNDLFMCHKCGHDNEPISETKDYFGLNKFVKEVAEEILISEEEVVSSPSMKYKIYSDMDGVLTDFNKSFEKYSKGMPPRDYEKKFGKDKFWELIDGKGKVGFWAGMPWMEDGKQYWDYIKDYDTELLSSPSRSSTSRLGKRLWVKNNMPGIKLTLAQAHAKQNYAAPNHILIDDRKSNIEQWISQGGIGILHTSAADTIQQLKKLGI